MSLIAHYKLDGTATDYSGNNFHGTISGDGSWVTGKLNKAYYFSSDNSCIQIPHNSVLSGSVFGTSKNFSFATWVNILSIGAYSCLIQKSFGLSWSNTTFGIWLANGLIYSTIGANVNGNPTGSSTQHAFTPLLNEWMHLVVTADGEYLNTYCNNIFVNKIRIDNVTYLRSENTNPITIGPRTVGSTSPSRWYQEDTRIYDHCLSLKEIKELSLGKIANYKLNDYGVKATGGTETQNKNYYIHTFTSSGTFEVLNDGDIEILMVGGGGAGGNGMGAGGGAGGVIHHHLKIEKGSYPIIIGSGGAGTLSNITVNGNDTTFNSLTAYGGGGGNSLSQDRNANIIKGANGGSGGGSGGLDSARVSSTTAAQRAGGNPLQINFGFGSKGGDCNAGGTNYPGAGGGGALQDGESITSASMLTGGKGGNGYPCDINGTYLYWGGGGGGNNYLTTGVTGGAGGLGGGGGGSVRGGTGGAGGGSALNTGGSGYATANTRGGHGGANTGGGGGGASWSTAPGGNGGSGIVIIRYEIPIIKDSLTIDNKNPIIWAENSGSNISILNNSITKTTTTSSWDCGSISKQKYGNNCFVEYTINLSSALQDATMIGLTSTQTTWSYYDIHYAFYINHSYFSGNYFSIYSNGSSKGVVYITEPFDGNSLGTFRIEHINGIINFIYNGFTVYSMGAIHTNPLFAKVSLHCYGTPNTVTGYMGDLGNSCYSNKTFYSYNNELDRESHYFNGIDSKIHTNLSCNNVKTVSLWYKNIGPYKQEFLIGSQTPTNSRFYIGWGNNLLNGGIGNQAWCFSSNIEYQENIWNHVAMTFNGNTAKLYHNAQLVSTINNITMDTSTDIFRIGNLSSSSSLYYKGYLSDIRFYATALEQKDIEYIYKNIFSIDSHGNLFLNNNIKEDGNYKNAYLNLFKNKVGAGSIGPFISNGYTYENRRIPSLDPWENNIVLWEARPNAVSDADGGYNSEWYNIDNTKLYRFSIWMKRNVIGNGSLYFGTAGSANVLRSDTLASDGNPYFYSSSVSTTEWRLFVGHVHPVGYNNGIHEDSGIYLLNGTKSNISRDFVCQSSTTLLRLRAYLYYSTNINTRQQFAYPRIDLCDGSEPSIKELLNGYSFYSNKENFDLNTPKNFYFNKSKTSLHHISNKIISDGLVAYYPLNGNCNDYSGYGNHGTPYNLTTVQDNEKNNSFLLFNGTNSYIDCGRSKETDLSNAITISVMVKNNETLINQIRYIVAKRLISNGLGGYIVGANSNSVVRGLIYDPVSGWIINETTEPYFSQEWKYITFTYDKNKLKLYDKGNLLKEYNFTGKININNSSLFIGRSSSNDFFWKGIISQLRIYNRILSENEIKILYELNSNNKLFSLKSNGILYIK